MSNKKTSLQQALIEAKEIETAAFNKAKKALEESISSKIDEVAKETLKEIEASSLNEDVELVVAPDAELSISVDAEGTKVSVEGEVKVKEDSEKEEETITTNTEEDMEEMFEIEGLKEEAPATAASVEPVAETPAVEAPESDVNAKLDAILAKLDNISAEETAEVEAQETVPAEGEVQIVDDTTAAPVEAPAPVAEEVEMEEEIVYEMEEEGAEQEGMVYETEDDILEMFNEMGMMDEIEIVDEEEELDETTGLSAVERLAGKKMNMAVDREKAKGHHAPVAPISRVAITESKDNAQNEAKFAELQKENESLKEVIKEYKDSFIVLRKQVNEVQVFNAKLAYVNKLFTSGGLSNDEKLKIAEQFDSIETKEEAKKLYNKLITENKVVSKVNPIDKLKSTSPAVAAEGTNSQTLFESEEMKRRKFLAGIK